MASAKWIPCLRTLLAAFRGSHSNVVTVYNCTLRCWVAGAKCSGRRSCPYARVGGYNASQAHDNEMPEDKLKSPWTQKQLDGFHRAAESLKLYRRAELQDESTGATLVKQLYVDPLPSDHILSTLMKANTTFLVGRKGTGKSTVFQRVQAEVRHRPGYASAYRADRYH